MRKEVEDFSNMRYGMFIHFGLYSMLGRGEWVMNREQISPAEMEKIAKQFKPDQFNAEELCQLAVDGGMKYIVLTTMHHEGFRLYDTKLTNYNAKAVCGRDLVEEFVNAARKYGLKIGLYHSLNNWFDQPDAVAALESEKDYEIFIEKTLARIKELAEKFAPFDIMWYDGWWPFDAKGWQAERMNKMVSDIIPNVIFNGRNCLPGDFGTPEGHLAVPNPWRPWEACMTLNDHWGYHISDNNWKSPKEIVKMLLTCANGKGNLLLNVGPRGDGSVPEETSKNIRQVGEWLRNGGEEAISNNNIMKLSAYFRSEDERTDWDGAGVFTASGNNMFMTIMHYPGKQLTLTGLEMNVKRITTTAFGELNFVQNGGKIVIDLPEAMANAFCPVLKMECDSTPSIYRTGGMRIPNCKHTRYDPAQSDIQY